MQLQTIEDENFKLNKRNLNFQRWFYALIGLSVVSIFLILNYHQIKMVSKARNQEYPIHLLFIIHSSLSKLMDMFLFFLLKKITKFPFSLCTHLFTFNSNILSYATIQNDFLHIFCLFLEITNAVLTTLSIVLLTAYTGIHFYVRFLALNHRRNDDFLIMIVRDFINT